MRIRARILVLIVFLLNTTAHAEDGKFYSGLAKLEQERLNNLSETKKRLEKFSQFTNEFNKKELELYNFILAHSKIMAGDLDNSKNILSRLVKTTSDADIRGRAYALLGIVYRFKGDNVNSFVSIDNALKELKTISDPRHRSAILGNTVSIYRDADLLEFALEQARRLLSEANKLKLDETYCVANLELGGIEVLVGNFKLAKQRVLVAKEHCEKLKTPLLNLLATEYLIKAHLEEKEIERSFELLEEYYPVAMDFEWNVLKAMYKSLFAEAHLINGDAQKALPYAKKSYELISRGVDFKRKEIATRLLAKIYDELGEKDKALKYYKEYMMHNRENKIKIRQRKLAFDIARRGRLN